MRLSCILIIENYKQNLAYFLLIFSLKIEKKSSNCYFKIIQTRSIWIYQRVFKIELSSMKFEISRKEKEGNVAKKWNNRATFFMNIIVVE